MYLLIVADCENLFLKPALMSNVVINCQKLLFHFTFSLDDSDLSLLLSSSNVLVPD